MFFLSLSLSLSHFDLLTNTIMCKCKHMIAGGRYFHLRVLFSCLLSSVRTLAAMVQVRHRNAAGTKVKDKSENKPSSCKESEIALQTGFGSRIFCWITEALLKFWIGLDIFGLRHSYSSTASVEGSPYELILNPP